MHVAWFGYANIWPEACGQQCIPLPLPGAPPSTTTTLYQNIFMDLEEGASGVGVLNFVNLIVAAVVLGRNVRSVPCTAVTHKVQVHDYM